MCAENKVKNVFRYRPTSSVSVRAVDGSNIEVLSAFGAAGGCGFRGTGVKVGHEGTAKPGRPSKPPEWALLAPLGAGGCRLYDMPGSLCIELNTLPESDPVVKLAEGCGSSGEQFVGDIRSERLKLVSWVCGGKGKKSLNWQSMSRLSRLNSTMFGIMSKGSGLEDGREDVEEEPDECDWEI